MIFSYLNISISLVILLKITSIDGLATSCQKNRFIDYNQLIETTCLINDCIRLYICSDTLPCKCKRDFVVQYNVSIEHDDDQDDEHDDETDAQRFLHFGVITQAPVGHNRTIIIGETYRCFYDERDVTTVFWIRPNRQTYYILLVLCLILVFAIILVPIMYVILILKFTNSQTKKKNQK
ncbi:unnamed protein product [Adineta steineri]|uniref:Uncharacterized protein n=1 Tax=Adineta steineri TaxID=433720 RepID=A0A813Z0E5_9BILA|nr:unnamed protein product [Adineta steineri]CAF0892530.1 unnamed protein product [Adineta steineri]